MSSSSDPNGSFSYELYNDDSPFSEIDVKKELAKLREQVSESTNQILKEQNIKLTDTDKFSKAMKFDGQKPRMSLVPPRALREVAEVMTSGAEKYEAYNWLKGFQWTRLLDAAGRHMNSFTIGEDLDPETKKSHISHAICCLMMLRDIIELYPELDDRWKKPE